MLQFKSSSQKLFFWHQEASADRDQIILQQVNSLIHSQGDEDEEEYLEDVAMDGVEDTGTLKASCDCCPPDHAFPDPKLMYVSPTQKN